MVPTGRGRLNMAAWMVPNGEAIRCARARAVTAGCRTNNAPRSWKAMLEGNRVSTNAPTPTGAHLRRGRLPDTAISPLTRLRHKQCAARACRWGRRLCDGLFYGLINLAKPLTGAASPGTTGGGVNAWSTWSTPGVISVNYIATAGAVITAISTCGTEVLTLLLPSTVAGHALLLMTARICVLASASACSGEARSSHASHARHKSPDHHRGCCRRTTKFGDHLPIAKCRQGRAKHRPYGDRAGQSRGIGDKRALRRNRAQSLAGGGIRDRRLSVPSV